MKRYIFIFSVLLSLSFTLNAQYQTVGNGQSTSSPCGSGDCFQLTSATDWESGAVWADTKLDLTKCFSICYSANFGTDPRGADGIAFVLQNSPDGTAAIGVNGGGMGYQDIQPSFAVEFDTYPNGTSYGDLTSKANHCAVTLNGDMDNVSQITPLGTLEDGQCHAICMSWNPDKKRFIVVYDGDTIINMYADLVNSVFGGDTEAYWGLTSATGLENNNHVVCIENVENKCCDCEQFWRGNFPYDEITNWELKELGREGDRCCFEYHPFFDLDPMACSVYAYDIEINGSLYTDANSANDFVPGTHTYEAKEDIVMTRETPTYNWCFGDKEFDSNGEIKVTMKYYNKCGDLLEERSFILHACSGDCCDDFEFLVKYGCTGWGTAIFSGDHSACNEPYVAVAGFDVVQMLPGVTGLKGFLTLRPGETRRIAAYLIDINGDTICRESGTVDCNSIGNCNGWLIEDYLSSHDPQFVDLYLAKNPYIAVPVYGVKLNGTLAIDGLGSAINIPLPGASNKLQLGTIDPVADPTAVIEYLDANGTNICTDIVLIVPGTSYPLQQVQYQRKANTGVSDMEVKMMPNPANDRTQLSLNLVEEDAVVIQVLDYTGKQIFLNQKYDLTPGMHNIDISTSNLPNGMYLVIVKSSDSVETQKLVIQR